MRRPSVAKLVLLTVAGWLLASSGGADARQLAIAVRANSSTVSAEIRRVLPRSWPAVNKVLYSDGEVEVLVSRDLSPTAAADLFLYADRLETQVPDVLAAGELLRSPVGMARIYSGLVLAEYANRTELADIQTWARNQGFTVRRISTIHGHVLLEAWVSPISLPAILSRLPRGVPHPIDYEFKPVAPLQEWDIGGYHRLPPERNRIALELARGAAQDCHLAILERLKVVVDNTDDPDPGDDVLFVALESESDMSTAIPELLSEPQCVRWAGPALSGDVLRVLTSELIVQFADAQARDAAKGLLGQHNLQEVRELSYLDEGYLFRRVVNRSPEPSYELYSAGSDLLAAGYALLAVPNIRARNRPLGNCDTCTSTDMQPYLETLRASAAWSEATAGETVIGLLDGGFGTDPKLCDEVRVVAIQNSLECDGSCDTTAPTLCELTEIEDPDAWCTGPCGSFAQRVSMPDDTHAMSMALIAGAKRGNGDAQFVPCDFLGIAGGNPIVNVAQSDTSNSTEVADALFWMAGGDPNNSDYYSDALSGDAATVLNLSFARVFEADPCVDIVIDSGGTPATHLDCAEVCVEGESCSLIESVLTRLRRGGDPIRAGGVLVVNAMQYWRLEDNDFYRPETTVAAGTVRKNTFEPIHPTSGYPYTTHDEYVDLVTPMGDGTSFDFCFTDAGHTSASAAAVSGIAAMMFDVNPHLTADQAHCILRQTADDTVWDDFSTGQLNGTDPDGVAYGCGFTDGHSTCFGHGMANARHAVRAAKACHPTTGWGMIVDKSTGVVTGWEEYARFDKIFEVRDGDTLVTIFDPDAILWCPCDTEGAAMPPELFISGEVTLCLNCEIEVPEPLAEAIMDKLWALLRCIEAGKCRCDLLDPTCLAVELVNWTDRDFPDVRAELCVDEDCRPIVLDRRTWGRLERIRATFPPIDDEFRRFLRGRGESLPELRLYSGRYRIDFEAPVRFGRPPR